MKKKMKGYVLTFECIATIAMFAFFMNATLFSLATFDSQRYMSTILTTTIIQTAKSGGTNNSYTRMNNIGDIISNANEQIKFMDKIGLNARITGGPEFVTSNNKKVHCTLDWTYPGLKIWYGVTVFDTHRSITVEMDSLVSPGKLIN